MIKLSKKRMTNDEFVHDLMNFSRYGALSQVMVLQAIDAYTKQVAAADLEELRKQMAPDVAPDAPIVPLSISPDAWHGVAVDIQRRLASHFER